ADQRPAPVVIDGVMTPVEVLYRSCAISDTYFSESEKYASSAVTRLRRSDFMAVTYAFDFVLANFGIAIAAKMPMMTTTISSSMSGKPFRARNMEDMNKFSLGEEIGSRARIGRCSQQSQRQSADPDSAPM